MTTTISSVSLPDHGVLDAEKILRMIPHYDPWLSAGDRYEFDAGAAQHALDFFPETLRHVKGRWGGKPFKLELWQAAIVANLFGWRDAKTGFRRYRDALLYVGKKNGKTCLAAGIILYMLTQDHEPGAELYSAASSTKQAELVFQQVVGMIRHEKNFGDMLKVYGASGAATTRAVIFEIEMSSYRCLSSDGDRADGCNVYAAVIDELHRHKGRDLTDILIKSTAARSQSLILFTTTADYQRPSLCNEKRKYSLQVRDGIIDDPHHLPCIYEIEKDDDPTDPTVWRKANPNLDVTIPSEFLARELKKGQTIPAEMNNFLRLHLNLVTDAAQAWISIDDWDRLTPISEDELVGLECHVGVDLSSTKDLTAVVLVFRLPDDELAILPRFWIPGDTARTRSDRDRIPYSAWIRDGDLLSTPGNCVDYERVRSEIVALSDKYRIRSIGIDRWNATHLTTELTADGFECFEFRQSFGNFNPPTKEFERLMLERRIRPVSNPVMRWCLSNVVVEGDHAGNLKPSRKKSTEKIDGVVAALMGLGRVLAESSDASSVYNDRGITFF